MLQRIFLVLASALFAVTSTARAQDSSSQSAQGNVVAPQIIKSPNDTRNYRFVTLENKLRVLLVHDAQAEQAAAALDVNIGHGSDPKGREGLAHFLEHMLFLGTKKYPESGEYHKFINDHGGSNNAYTSFDHTNYFFAVKPEHLEDALDRFAQFFVAPLFNSEFVQRERTVVHSEYTGKKKEEGRRWWSAFKQSFNPTHPMGQFSVGSLETLADRDGSNIRDELIDFYRNHYSANIMRLVVVGQQDLDSLESLVVERFSAVPNYDLQPQAFDMPLFATDNLPRQLNIVPLREERSLTLTFPLPSLKDWWMVKPAGYLGNIIGHEGEGSLLAYLRELGWSDSLSAGQGVSSHTTSTFQISLELTPEGVEHVDEVIALIFQTIDMVRTRGVQRWLFDESKALADIGFRFQEKSRAASLARGLASRLHDYPAKDILRIGYAYDEFSADTIRLVLDRLVPENLLLTFSAPGVEADQTTPRFDAAYSLAAIPDERIEAFKQQNDKAPITLPARNPFLPENLAIIDDPAADSTPVSLIENKGFELWHDVDTEFGVPKSAIYFSVRTPNAHATPEQAVLTDLFIRLLNDQLNEFSYPARLAGLSYSLYSHLRGFSTRISGYSDSQPELLSEILKAINEPQIDPKRFAQFREDLLRALRNQVDDAPYEQILDETHRVVMRSIFSRDAMTSAAQSATLERLNAHIENLMEVIDVSVLVHGNTPQDKAMAIGEQIKASLLEGREVKEVDGTQVVDIGKGVHLRRELTVNHDDSAVTVYFQGNDQSLEHRAQFAMLTQIIESPYYETIRTREQLGYFVFASSMTVLEVPGLALTVQSPTTGPHALEGRIDAFISDFIEQSKTLTADEFERQKQSLIARLTKRDTELSARTNRYWRELDRQQLQFNTRDQMAKAIENVDLKSFADFVASILVADTRKRMVVWSKGNAHNEDPVEPVDGSSMIQSSDEFKESARLFPSIQTKRRG